jgi:GntR family transcriptional regulator, transcriptional repressor for pyruvate dehydrogenase complex
MMKELLTPIKTESLKDLFVSRFENLILSGQIAIGEKLLAERELALKLGVSRPVVHDGLVELANRGLVTLTPRVGAVVNDYRKEGSLAILTSLLNYHNGRLEDKLFKGLLDFRALFENENARLAALNRTEEHLQEFRELLRKESRVDVGDIAAVTDLDFSFHHLVALAGGNMIYPLILNSFKQVYTSLTRVFFSDPAVIPVVFAFHRDVVNAIESQNEIEATEVMKKILAHGERHLTDLLAGEKRSEL